MEEDELEALTDLLHGLGLSVPPYAYALEDSVRVVRFYDLLDSMIEESLAVGWSDLTWVLAAFKFLQQGGARTAEAAVIAMEAMAETARQASLAASEPEVDPDNPASWPTGPETVH